MRCNHIRCDSFPSRHQISRTAFSATSRTPRSGSFSRLPTAAFDPKSAVEIAAKIAEGKVRKFLEENTLINQKYVLDETTTVKKVLPSGVSVKGFKRY